MKRLILFLLILMMAVTGISCAAKPHVEMKSDGAVVRMKTAAPLSSIGDEAPVIRKDVEVESTALKSPLPYAEPADEVLVGQSRFHDDIPLSYEEQEWLQDACAEFDVPYALALGLIEKETTFRNIVGDDGASTGYMQIQEKWHHDRMERLGVTDLLDPRGNFLVGCDYLSELYAKYGDWDLVVTVYNMGHDPGCISEYAKTVMGNYERWQELLETYD